MGIRYIFIEIRLYEGFLHTKVKAGTSFLHQRWKDDTKETSKMGNECMDQFKI